MQKIILTLLALIFISTISEAQQTENMKGSSFCAQQKMHSPNLVVIPRGPNSPGHSYDMLNYTLDLDLYNCYTTPYPKSFSGSCIIHFRIDSTLNQIKLNAVNSSMTIDSVSMAGISFTHTSDTLYIILDKIYAPGEEAYVKIYYYHKNISDGAIFTGGGFFYTDAEPQGARCWFPSWDHPSDKATLDLTAKVPTNVKLGSNGRLADSINTGSYISYHWISRDPIATYLMVISSKVNYQLHIVHWPFPPNPDSTVPIRFYFNQGENPVPMENIISEMTSFYSDLFGWHPFEKNGFASLDYQFVWGGMENQTLTSLLPGYWYQGVISHEYSHQWFGDMITCGTWADIWLNEGFATYIETLWIEHLNGYNAYKNAIDDNAYNYLYSNPGWPIVNPDWAFNPPSNDILFNYAITYLKGSCVLHMFRYVVSDELFFDVLKQYAEDTVNFKYKTAVTEDFVAKVNEVTSGDYSWFFNEWLYYPDHPNYQNTYNFQDLGNGNWRVNFRARQTQLMTFFKMPLELKIKFIDQSDTLLRVMNDSNLQWSSFNFNKQPIQLVFDPNNNIVLKQGSTVVGTDEMRKTEGLYIAQNIPNPFENNTVISYEIPDHSNVAISVYNLMGQKIKTLLNEKQEAGSHIYTFNAGNLKTGVYYYRIEACGQVKIMKMIVVK